MLNLPDGGQHVFLHTADKFFLLSKTESEAFNKILTSFIPGQVVNASNHKLDLESFQIFFCKHSSYSWP